MSEATSGRRPDEELVRGLSAWAAQREGATGWSVVGLERPSSGWANETVILTVRGAPPPANGGDGPMRLVVRMPALVPVFPSYDLAAQARVLEAVRAAGVAAPEPMAVEADPQWVGTPFLVMSHEPGRPGPEVPTLDRWLLDAPAERQRHLHTSFVDLMAGVHAVDWQGSGLGGVLRGAAGTLADEVDWWSGYVQWATDGSPPPLLEQAARWCRSTVPHIEGEGVLCWGDVRIGNVLYDDRYEIAAVLDWEMASLGDPATDLGWYLALDGLVEHFTGRSVPGFLPRGDVVARYEAASGRRLVHLGWHELFALLRSVAVSERLARVAARGGGSYPGGGGNDSPVLQELIRRIEAFGGR